MSSASVAATDERLARAREIVRTAVDASSLRAVGEDVGVSHTTVANFLDPSLPVADKTVRLVLKWVETAGRAGEADGGMEEEENYPARKLDEIDALDAPEHTKMLKAEVFAAVLRAEAARIEARAAVVRARAIEKAEGAAESRAKAIERAEESAAQRMLALHPEGPTPTEGGDGGKALRSAKRATGLAARQKRKRGGEGGRRAGGS